MKVRNIAMTIAASIVLSSSVLAETDEERMMANCDWPENGTAANVAPVLEADKTSTAAAAKGPERSDEDLFASCDHPEGV